jgi:hypothetical protein
VKDLLAHDDSLRAHRLYENFLLGTDQRARAIAEYDARLAAHPGDPNAEYLALRVKPADDERKLADTLAAKYPESAWLRRTQLYVHYEQVEFDGMVAAAEALRAIDRKLWAESIDAHVEGLVGLDRGKDALDLANGVSKDAALDEDANHGASLLAFRVAHRIGAPEPQLKASTEDIEAVTLLARAATGTDIPRTTIDGIKDEDVRNALLIAKAARQSPPSALTLVEQASDSAMHGTSHAVRMLLLGEAVRLDRSGPFLRKIISTTVPPRQIAHVLAYLKTGESSDEVLGLPLEARAALDFARSRMPNVTPDEKAAVLARAKKSDVMQGPVTIAMQGWPAP